MATTRERWFQAIGMTATSELCGWLCLGLLTCRGAPFSTPFAFDSLFNDSQSCQVNKPGGKESLQVIGIWEHNIVIHLQAFAFKVTQQQLVCHGLPLLRNFA